MSQDRGQGFEYERQMDVIHRENYELLSREFKRLDREFQRIHALLENMEEMFEKFEKFFQLLGIDITDRYSAKDLADNIRFNSILRKRIWRTLKWILIGIGSLSSMMTGYVINALFPGVFPI